MEHGVLEVHTSCLVSKEVVYDEINLPVGSKVERIEDWKLAAEGHYIAHFRTEDGTTLPLLMDEVSVSKEQDL